MQEAPRPWGGSCTFGDRTRHILPWLPEVYANLSVYVHLSRAHILGLMLSVQGHAASWGISATGEHMPESSWIEVA